VSEEHFRSLSHNGSDQQAGRIQLQSLAAPCRSADSPQPVVVCGRL